MIRTVYRLWGTDGGLRIRTDSPNVAQAWSNIGFRVTAETTKQDY